MSTVRNGGYSCSSVGRPGLSSDDLAASSAVGFSDGGSVGVESEFSLAEASLCSRAVGTGCCVSDCGESVATAMIGSLKRDLRSELEVRPQGRENG